jgi:hypothetical protein
LTGCGTLSSLWRPKQHTIALHVLLPSAAAYGLARGGVRGAWAGSRRRAGSSVCHQGAGSTGGVDSVGLDLRTVRSRRSRSPLWKARPDQRLLADVVLYR